MRSTPNTAKSYGTEPPQLASLAYDAIALAALMAPGTPYHRFTLGGMTDPNGFSGVSGIFRFRADGSVERGLAVLEVDPGGFVVVSPAPTTFQSKRILVCEFRNHAIEQQAAARCCGQSPRFHLDQTVFGQRGHTLRVPVQCPNARDKPPDRALR